MIALACVPTTTPAADMRRLCKHFDHRATARDDHTGHIAFRAGTCELVAGADQLTVIVKADDTQQLARLQHLLANHLERFGQRDQLTVSWQPPSTGGTREQ